MKYALLDWDNTIRNGYTLLSLVDYLVENNIIDQTTKTQIDLCFSMYRIGGISHDTLAEKACEIFAQSLYGLKEELINHTIAQFIQADKKKLFSFSSTIFRALHQHNITPIIVSGAPTIVIEQYAEFHINKIFGFSMEIKNGIYTGKVLSNYGFNKKSITSEIISQMKQTPEIAFGDSLSDYDMLSMSKHSIIVGGSNTMQHFKTDGIIPIYASNSYVRTMIFKILSGTSTAEDALVY